MTALAIIHSMSKEQARRISALIRTMKAGDLVGAKSVMDGLTAEELETLIAVLNAAQATREHNRKTQARRLAEIGE